MAANRDIRDFFELRAGFQGMYDFCDAALAFLDRQGIAPRKMVRPRNVDTNGNGHRLQPNFENLRAAAKARYATRDASVAHEPDGQHITIQEATEILGLTDSGVRVRVKTGKLPPATYEWRTDDDGIRAKKQVVLREAVEQMAAEEGRTRASTGKKRPGPKTRKAKGQSAPDEPLPSLKKGSLKGLKGFAAVTAALEAVGRPIRPIHLGAAMKKAGYKGSITSVGVLLPTLVKKDDSTVARNDAGLYHMKNA